MQGKAGHGSARWLVKGRRSGFMGGLRLAAMVFCGHNTLQAQEVMQADALSGIQPAVMIFQGKHAAARMAMDDSPLAPCAPLYASQHFPEAFACLKPYADQGNAEAQFGLGAMYYYGEGVSQDFGQAFSWTQKAAEQGLAEAQYNLGILYYSGQGVARDDTKAVYWYQKAADQGFAEAQNNLGLMYMNGFGVSQDPAKANEWFRKAAEQGNDVAQYNLGVNYALGRGVPQDINQAVYWLQKSADQGNMNAIIVLRQLGY